MIIDIILLHCSWHYSMGELYSLGMGSIGYGYSLGTGIIWYGTVGT